MEATPPPSLDELVTPRPGLYLCSRSSLNFGEAHKKPCDEAFRVRQVIVDTRTVDDPEELLFAFDVANWYSHGTNHRVEGGMIKRDMGVREVWAVQITDLQAFVDRHGKCVVSRDRDGFATVEIYDDWRE